ncbi:MAG: hypothetical protein V1837_07755 [Candidatus Woesearchaeota archaeon]
MKVKKSIENGLEKASEWQIATAGILALRGRSFANRVKRNLVKNDKLDYWTEVALNRWYVPIDKIPREDRIFYHPPTINRIIQGNLLPSMRHGSGMGEYKHIALILKGFKDVPLEEIASTRTYFEDGCSDYSSTMVSADFLFYLVRSKEEENILMNAKKPVYFLGPEIKYKS